MHFLGLTSYFSNTNTESKRETEESHVAPTPWGRVGPPAAPWGGVGPMGVSSRRPFAYLFIFTGKP